ncbi:MAG TPA: hypothetical protein VND68_14025 [Chloroflexia bacterium]|jgi:hypothetical protein|nr:hypothetical protein [Chloroflexia bacterium]
MEAKQLGLGIIWRMVGWGAGLGALLGSLFPLLAALLIQLLTVITGNTQNEPIIGMWAGASTWVLVGFLVGFGAGGVAGILLGFITGVVLAIMTYRAFTPILDFHRYRRAMEITSIVAGGTAALLLAVGSGLPQYMGKGWGGEWGWLVWAVVPVLIATIATWWAGRRVTNWAGATASKTSG